MAQTFFALHCRKSKAFLAEQLRKVNFIATELIHHLPGSWRALFMRSEAFR
jgi:hypothetical protein